MNPKLPCCVKADCTDPSNPFANLSAEAPDQDIYIGRNTGWDENTPPIGSTWGSLGCTSFCQSTISQEDADLCAARQQIDCTVNGGTNGEGGGGGGGGGWRDPQGRPYSLFYNHRENCSVLCPDGLSFNFGFAAGQILALSQAQADAIAQSFACINGQKQRLCMNEIQTSACVGEFYADTIDTDGGAPPLVFTVVSGSLPPGLGFEQNDNFSVDISGTPTTAGSYSFTVQVVDKLGNFMRKTYSMEVVGITNSPTQGQVGVAYSFQYTAAGGTSPYTFAITSGSLPAGLSMSTSGLITGTPTTSGVTAFTVKVTDSTP